MVSHADMYILLPTAIINKKYLYGNGEKQPLSFQPIAHRDGHCLSKIFKKSRKSIDFFFAIYLLIKSESIESKILLKNKKTSK